MPIFKENQPVIFNESGETCLDSYDYVQIVDNTDVTQFQFGLSVCAGQAQEFPDPTFSSASNYVLPSGWSIGSNLLSHSNGNGSPAYTLYNFNPSNTYYKVTIVVDSISSDYGYDVHFGSTYVGSIYTAGTFDFWGYPSGSIFFCPLLISPTTLTDEIVISAISGFEVLLNYGFGIYDTDNTYIDSIFYLTDVTYFNVYGNSVTVNIDWDALGISNGCYYIAMYDPCVNTGGQNYPAQITNEFFTGNATGWTLGSSWVYNSNAVDATFSATVANNWMTQSNVFVNTTSTYTVEVELTAHTGNVSVYFGTTYINNCTGVGTFTITGVPNGSDLKLYITSGTATVTRVEAIEVAPADYEKDYQTNNFKLSDYSCDCPKTLLINAVNAEDGLGFLFTGHSFSPRLRVQGKLKQAKYNSERNISEDSFGEKRVFYYNRRKVKTLSIDLLPEYIHDFLSTLVGYDKFYINGDEYFVEDDEYNVTYSETLDNVGSIDLLVSEKTQLIKNINCSSDEVDAVLPQIDCATGNLTNGCLMMQFQGSKSTIDCILLEDGTEILIE